MAGKCQSIIKKDLFGTTFKVNPLDKGQNEPELK